MMLHMICGKTHSFRKSTPMMMILLNIFQSSALKNNHIDQIPKHSIENYLSKNPNLAINTFTIKNIDHLNSTYIPPELDINTQYNNQLELQNTIKDITDTLKSKTHNKDIEIDLNTKEDIKDNDLISLADYFSVPTQERRELSIHMTMGTYSRLSRQSAGIPMMILLILVLLLTTLSMTLNFIFTCIKIIYNHRTLADMQHTINELSKDGHKPQDILLHIIQSKQGTSLHDSYKSKEDVLSIIKQKMSDPVQTDTMNEVSNRSGNDSHRFDTTEKFHETTHNDDKTFQQVK
mgnify:CR=1 FL=1